MVTKLRWAASLPFFALAFVALVVAVWVMPDVRTPASRSGPDVPPDDGSGLDIELPPKERATRLIGWHGGVH